MFRENLLIFWGIWGKAELMLRIWGRGLRPNTTGGMGIFYQEFVEINTFFSGSKGAQTPGVLNLRTLNLFVTDS